MIVASIPEQTIMFDKRKGRSYYRAALLISIPGRSPDLRWFLCGRRLALLLELLPLPKLLRSQQVLDLLGKPVESHGKLDLLVGPLLHNLP